MPPVTARKAHIGNLGMRIRRAFADGNCKEAITLLTDHATHLAHLEKEERGRRSRREEEEQALLTETVAAWCGLCPRPRRPSFAPEELRVKMRRGEPIEPVPEEEEDEDFTLHGLKRKHRRRCCQRRR